MKSPLISTLRLAISAALLSTAVTATAQTATAQLKVVAITEVDVMPAVKEAAARKKVSMDRVVQSLDGQLISALHSTRKYKVIGRSDAKKLIEEAAATGRSFAFGNADYLLVVSIDDFQDVVQRGNFGAAGTVQRRTIRLSAVGKIYNAKDNQIIETANFQTLKNLAEEQQANVSGDGDLSDSLLTAMSRDMAEKIATRVVDIGYPARVLARTGNQVTINRGDGTGIATGQLWEAFTLGAELVDPDTGTKLGREEVPVGKIRVIRVNPMTATGEISGEDLGVAKEAVLRRIEN